MTINILGTDYSIVKKAYEDDPMFKKNNIIGYCDKIKKGIVLCDMMTAPGWEDEDAEIASLDEKNTLRHEIVHAFLSESGLSDSAISFQGAWSTNEEMIDWIAIQGPKIYKAWKDVDAV